MSDKTKRIILDLPVREHSDVKAKLARKNSSIADWLRACVDRLLRSGR